MINVLFVCTGNICRSPTAEGIFNNILKEQGLVEHFYVDSAGTHDYHIGEAPDKRAQVTAKKNGIDISGLQARQVENEDFAKFDYIIAMDHYNELCLTSVCPKKDQHKISLLLNYLHKDVIADEVPDPYYGEGDGFQYVFELISEAAHGLLEFIRKKHNL